MSEQNLSSTLMRMKGMLPDAVPDISNTTTGDSNETKSDGVTKQVFESCKEEQKIEQSIKALTNSLLTTVNSIKSMVKKQNDIDLTNSSLEKKVKDLQSSCVTAAQNIQKENHKIEDIDSRPNQIEKQIKTFDKKLEQGEIQSDTVDLIRKELSQMQTDVLKAVKETLHEANETKNRIKNIASDFEKLKIQVLDVMEATGCKKTSHSGNALVFELVKEELFTLTNVVTKAYKDCVVRIEKDYTHDKKEVEKLRATLDSVQQENNVVENRMSNLENSFQLYKEQLSLEKFDAQNKVIAAEQEENPSAHMDRVIIPKPKSTESKSNLSYFQKAQLYLNNQVERSTDEASTVEVFSTDRKHQPQNSGAIIAKNDDVKHVLQETPMSWKIKKSNRENKKIPLYLCKVFYTKCPGYKIQVRAYYERSDCKIYFAIRMLNGIFDDQLKWPFEGQFKIQVQASTKSKESEVWVIPSTSHGIWQKQNGKLGGLGRPNFKINCVYSQWVGPFDTTEYVFQNALNLKIELVDGDGYVKNMDIMPDASQQHSFMVDNSKLLPPEFLVEKIEYVLQGSPMEWKIRKRKGSEIPIQRSREFYTKVPGHRMHLNAKLERENGNIYFAIRMLDGIFDDKLDWPFEGQFRIQIHPKSLEYNDKKCEPWIIPSAESGVWEKGNGKLVSFGKRKHQVHSGWVGPFDVSDYVDWPKFFLLVELVEDW